MDSPKLTEPKESVWSMALCLFHHGDVHGAPGGSPVCKGSPQRQHRAGGKEGSSVTLNE